MPCTALHGVGAKQAERLARCGIHVVADLLFHLPLRYQDRTQVVPLNRLRLGDTIVVEAEVLNSHVKQGRRRSLIVEIGDGAGLLKLRFFHFTQTQLKQLQPGAKLRCFGEVRGWGKQLELVHPEYQLISEYAAPASSSDELTPVYPSTEGMTQYQWRRLAQQALACLRREAALPELLPADLLPAELQYDLLTAIQTVHQPTVEVNQGALLSGTHPAVQRLAFEELLAQQLSMRRLRQKIQHYSAKPLAADAGMQQQLIAALPFELTQAQQRVVAEISADMQRPHPMLRLVQGDVGSGKTVVAALALLQAIASGSQAAMMAPTELLAEQHYLKLCDWLEPLGIKLAFLAGSMRSKQRNEALQAIASGEAQLVIGTHALFQAGVTFQQLGLVVIDEQHRFGVHQRLALRNKGVDGDQYPHQLVMTATPIPRTLAMTAYAELDVSVIDELPKGRQPIQTLAISNQRRDEIVERIRQHVANGSQVYWVCPLIEESEALQCQAAEQTQVLLQEELQGLRIGLVHGRQKPAQKEKMMQQFKAATVDVLVATTVIEVGVDVPNATLMIIENAERMGLAQLHQLRGRVGRGSKASHCVLLYQKPLSPIARERLGIMRATNDGFKVAQKDLELRGPGEVLGTRQTGLINLRIADLARDQKLLSQVRVAADAILQHYPERVQPLIQRWLGSAEEYGVV